MSIDEKTQVFDARHMCTYLLLKRVYVLERCFLFHRCVSKRTLHWRLDAVGGAAAALEEVRLIAVVGSRYGARGRVGRLGWLVGLGVVHYTA